MYIILIIYIHYVILTMIYIYGWYAILKNYKIDEQLNIKHDNHPEIEIYL